MTQQRAGELVGLDPNTIARYETGRLRPSRTAIFALAYTYGTTVDWLMEGVEPESGVTDSNPPLQVDAASEALRAVAGTLSDEAVSLIADYIRFVHQRESRLGRLRREAR